MTRDALVVGINGYSNFDPLDTPAGDAEAIAKLLKQYGEFNVVKRLPECKRDGQLQIDPCKEVTVAQLQQALEQLFKPEGDNIPGTALFFFAGHGHRVKNQNGQYEGFLATSESDPEKGKLGLSLQWLRELLQDSPIMEQIVWLDCCHSGELFNFTKTELGENLKGRSRCFIAAAREFEPAYAEINGHHGALGGALLQGLNPNQSNSQEWVTAFALCDFVQRHFEKMSLPQQPVIANFGKIRLIHTVPPVVKRNWFTTVGIIGVVAVTVIIAYMWLPKILPTTNYPVDKPPISASNVELIDSSLDQRDSPYTQSQKESVKQITPKPEIQVEQIRTKGYDYDYNFPTIDFKFQNTGNATAFLKQFAVRVTQAEIDLTPVLEFKGNVVNGALQITVSNKGWGSSNCQFELEEHTLNRLFTPLIRQKNIVLGSGDEREIFHLTLNMANAEQLALVNKEFVDMSGLVVDMSGEEEEFGTNKSGSSRSKTVRGLVLGAFQASWNCKDEKNFEYDGLQKFGVRSTSIDCSYDVFIATDGFRLRTNTCVSHSMKRSDTVYITIIDPQQKGSQELTYPISRQIPPGEVERFHIMVGSSMSAKLRLQFEFSIDKNKTVESEEFEINIWNPRDSWWTGVYADGDELHRQLDHKKHLLAEEQEENNQCQAKQRHKSMDCSKWQLEELQKEVERLKRQVANYPFSDVESKSDSHR